LAATRASASYQTNIPFNLGGGPQFTDTSYDGLGSYTYSIVPNPTAAVSTIAPNFPVALSTGSWETSPFGYSNYDDITSWNGIYAFRRWGESFATSGTITGVFKLGAGASKTLMTFSGRPTTIGTGASRSAYMTVNAIEIKNNWLVVNFYSGSSYITEYYFLTNNVFVYKGTKKVSGSTDDTSIYNKILMGSPSLYSTITRVFLVGVAGASVAGNLKSFDLSSSGTLLYENLSVNGSYIDNFDQITGDVYDVYYSGDWLVALDTETAAFRYVGASGNTAVNPSGDISAPPSGTSPQWYITVFSAAETNKKIIFDQTTNTLYHGYGGKSTSVATYGRVYVLRDSTRPAGSNFYSYNRTAYYTQENLITNPPGTVNNDGFGNSISIYSSNSVDYLLVGCPNDTSSTGSAHLFSRTGSTWSFVKSYAGIFPATTGFGSQTGKSVEIKSGIIMIHSEYSSATGGGSRPEQLKIDYILNPFSFNSGTKVLTVTGNRLTVNQVIDSLQVTPATGYTSNFELIYTGTARGVAVSQRNQNIIHP
jgi:hypothetical protein